MLVINYNGNKPVGKNYKYSVQYNNNADIVRLVFLATPKLKELFGSELENGSFYVKCQCVDDDYYDRIIVDNPTFDEDENAYYVDFVLKAQQTCHDYIDFSLSIENDADEIVWQTQIVRIDILNGIDADEQIVDKYPSIIQYLLNNMGGGSNHDVQIERVWLSYEKGLLIKVCNVLSWYNESDDKHLVNDASKIFVNFKTTPISEKDIEEINNGRFVIRFDYYIRSKPMMIYSAPEHKVVNKDAHRINQRNAGAGYRTFRRSLYNDQDEYNQYLEKSLIFITPNDIKTNAYGEKYIHKVISYVDLINYLYTPLDSENQPDFSNKFKAVNDEEDIGSLFRSETIGHIGIGGIPRSTRQGDTGGIRKDFSTTTAMRITDANGNGKPVRANKLQYKGSLRLTKLNPAFTIYAPFQNDAYQGQEHVLLYSPFTLDYRSRRHKLTFRKNDGDVYSLFDADTYRKNVAVKPRCCIISLDYKTNKNNIWLKKYSQSDQNIRAWCKSMVFDYQLTKTFPVFRIAITKK